ncbi:glutathione S-transferase-like isoform X2 [Bradysia coprophila]|uniref:glutathione S-transferase-like isoform X2 n=1 Tax=Bradysia coprophila TaxID=38358 RepID=UPI00187DD0C2|nr:glutathione S-transferase-like isoform X2 [Bradysia coprophila]
MSYKLTYFDTEGIAEPIRLLFAYAEQPFEDVRLPKDDFWPKLRPEVKSQFTWGTIPVLELSDHPGQMISQSMAIARFLAKRFNLVGDNDFESAKCDELCDALKDYVSTWSGILHETDPAKRAARFQTALTVETPKTFGKLNEILLANGGTWLVGNRLSWTDLLLAHTNRSLQKHLGDKADLTAGYPALKAHSENVFNIPTIKAYVDKRDSK